MSPSQFQRVTEQEPLYQLWRGEPLSPVELAMLALVIKHWRAGTPIERDVAEFELVQAGHPYKEVHDSRAKLYARSPPAITAVETSEAQDLFSQFFDKNRLPDGATSPQLAGLIELGDEACIADLNALGRIVEALRTLYHPARRQPSMEAVAALATVPLSDVQRLAPLTGVYKMEGFQLEGYVLGWSSFEAFLSGRLGMFQGVEEQGKKPALLDLEIDFTPSHLRWDNLGPYEEASLEISPITALVGGNGTGKTSALRAFALLRDIAAHGVESIDSNQAGSSFDLLRDASGFGFALQGQHRVHGEEERKTNWSASFVMRPHFTVSSEMLEHGEAGDRMSLDYGVGRWLGANQTQTPVHLRPNQLALRELVDPKLYAAIIAVRQSIARWVILTERATHNLPRFDLSGSSFSGSLDLKDLEAAASSVLGTCRLQRRGAGRFSFVDAHGHRSSLEDAPRGVGQVVGILAYLLQSNPPSLLAIDEIENHLHTDVIERLIEVMRGVTHRTRVLFTTHSASVLRCVSPNEVSVIRAEGNASGITRADRDPTLSRLVESGSMSELLEQGYFARGQ
jgi:hypothetical protein